MVPVMDRVGEQAGMLQSLVTQIGAGAIVAVCLYALVAGAWRERFGAVIYLTAYLLTMGFGVIAPGHSTLYLLLGDMVCLQAFLFMCWKTPHPWPKWAVVGQLVCVIIEIATLMKVGIRSFNFLTVETTAGWAVLMSLLIGTIAAAQVKRQARQLL